MAIKHWTGLTSAEAARKAADLLADYDHLRKEVRNSGETGGRSSERYAINPAVLSGKGVA